MTTDQGKQKCGTCSGEYTVTAAGGMRHHFTDNLEFQAGPDSRKCAGVGQPPAGAGEDTDENLLGYICRVCHHPVVLTDNGRARTHLDLKQERCDGGSDWPLRVDKQGNRADTAPTEADQLKEAPGGGPVAVHCFHDCGHVVRDTDPEAAHVAMEQHYRVGCGVLVDDGRTEAEQFTDTPSTLVQGLKRETAGTGTVLNALSPEQRDALTRDHRTDEQKVRDARMSELTREAVKVLEQRTPEQKAETAARMDRTASAALGVPVDPALNHECTDPSGTKWVHPGPEESCGTPDCELLRDEGDNPASQLPVGETDDGRPCDHRDGVFGIEGRKAVCVACGMPCTHPGGFTENDPEDDDGEGLIYTCPICGAVDGGEPIGPDPELPNCPHPGTHRAGCGCPEDDYSPRQYTPDDDPQVLLGDLQTGEYFVRRGTLMRVTDTLSGDVQAVVVGGPHDGRTGVLPNNHEVVNRAPDLASQTKERETQECHNETTSPTSSPTRTTGPARGSRPPTPESAPAVLPNSNPVTSSAPTAKAATKGRSAAVTTDQSKAAADFLAGAGGTHGEAETKRDRFGRYLLPHPDTGKEQAWTRATTFAKSISDTYALGQWGLRMCLLGATKRPDVVARAHGKHVRADKSLLDELTADLKDAAGDKVAANLGTAMHSFTEMVDKAWHTPAGPRSVLDEVPEAHRDDVETYIKMLESTGLEPVPGLVEFTTAVKQYGVAGTSDNCYRVTRPLTVDTGRGPVTMNPGEYVIGDKKTGRNLDYGWGEIAIQLGTYGQGLVTCGVYDRAAGTWNPKPLGDAVIRTDVGIVIHLPVEKTDKEPAVYGIDLESGWNAAVLCERVRAWRKTRKLAAPVVVSEVEVFAASRPKAAEEQPVVSRTTVRPPTLRDEALAVTTKTEASAVWRKAKLAGLSDAKTDELIKLMQKRLAGLEEIGG